MIEIRKTIILRETFFSELGVEANRPITRAVGWRSFATRSGCDRRGKGADRSERQGGRGGGSARRAARAQDDSWSFPHFDTITVSVADAPRPDEILVVTAIADGGRLRNRCGTEPIR